jgi:hypothetical protein
LEMELGFLIERETAVLLPWLLSLQLQRGIAGEREVSSALWGASY